MATLGDGIVQGRQLFHAGRLHAAEQCWRKCLKEAYAQGNHAATFVLSKNLGDVTADHAEALQFYEYALELATTCGVLRDPSLRSVVAMIAVAMQDLDSNRHACQACQAPDQRIFRQPTAQETHLCFRCYEQQVNTDETIYACTTCGNDFSLQKLTRDTDDELYCKPCYDAYHEDQDDDGNEGENEKDKKAADRGIPCDLCLDADGTVRESKGFFYCQPCFVRKNQPRELPTTRTAQRPPATVAKKQSSGTAKSSSSAYNGAKRLVHDQAPVILATNRRPPVKKSQVYAAPIPTTASSAPRTLAAYFVPSTSTTSKRPSKENGRSRSSASSSTASTRATPKGESKSIPPITPNAATASSPSSSLAEPLTPAIPATSDATTAADPGMLCTACLNANGTVRDWKGLFFCQPCFVRKNQTPIDFVADVGEPDELPATTPTAAKKKNSGPAKPSPSANHGPKRLVDDQAASMSLRGLSTSCPTAPVKKSSVYAMPTSAPSAPRTLASYFAPSTSTTPETPSEETSGSPSSPTPSGSPTPATPNATAARLPSSSPAAPSTPTQEEESESITPVTLDTASSTQENSPPHLTSPAPSLSPATPEANIEPPQVESAALALTPTREAKSTTSTTPDAPTAPAQLASPVDLLSPAISATSVPSDAAISAPPINSPAAPLTPPTEETPPQPTIPATPQEPTVPPPSTSGASSTAPSTGTLTAASSAVASTPEAATTAATPEALSKAEDVRSASPSAPLTRAIPDAPVEGTTHATPEALAPLPAASSTPDSQEAPSEATSDDSARTSITLDELAELLEHVCSCNASGPCIKCRTVRGALHHCSTCEAESIKSCHECRTIAGLLVAHAKSCGRPRDDCQVPRFKDVRKRVRGISKLAHQREMHLASQVGHIATCYNFEACTNVDCGPIRLMFMHFEEDGSPSSATPSGSPTPVTPKATAAPLAPSCAAATDDEQSESSPPTPDASTASSPSSSPPSTPTEEESLSPITPDTASTSSPSSSPTEPLTRAIPAISPH
ncbi:hypothetical protein AC1031_021530 [Aphanomyces cochlioides]|nr:hypothetical protein AC1031_021530 [Aphanomyces cochlioides]